jgi:hypothetical protein
MLKVNLLVVSERETVLELGAPGVQQKDAEHLVIDKAFELFADSLEKLVKIEDRREVAADFVQQNEAFRLPRYPRVKACVFNACRDTRRDEREQLLVLLGKKVFLRGFDIDDADDAVTFDQPII